MMSRPSESDMSIRRVHVFVDDLIQVEITVWSVSDEDAIGLACKAAREVVRSLPKRGDSTQRYAARATVINGDNGPHEPAHDKDVADP